MRMKHGSDRGPTTSAKPRLLAAFTAVAMMFATAVPAMLPKTAVAAADRDPSKDRGAICQPVNIEMGGLGSVNEPDTGVATWVGGDMYVGAPRLDANGSQLTEYNKTTKPLASTAVEAEGLTLVNGKLVMDRTKKSWDGSGFRFGVVGFGAQFRPASGSDALVVGGRSTLKLKDAKNAEVSALGYGGYGRGFVAGTNPTYNVKINGNTSYAPDASTLGSWGIGGTGDQSVYAANAGGGGAVNWVGAENPLKNVKIVGNTRTDFSNFQSTDVEKLSKDLKAITSSSEMTYKTELLPPATIQRNKYEGNHKAELYDVVEKKITFTGDGKKQSDGTITGSPLQVFTLPASELTDVYTAENGVTTTAADGIAFAFENIPDSASVAVNITGGGPITYHNGWRFWWNGTEIGNYYTSTDGGDPDLYSKAASAVMWNYIDTTKLTILGGQASRTSHNKKITDDPSAASIGSILVPKGTFDDHVTTNGRVYVGGDFYMNNQTTDGTPDAGENVTSSIVNMDQERHNFPWHGSMVKDCAAIQWNKVDQSGDTLNGTSWNVYKTLDDAFGLGTNPAGPLNAVPIQDGRSSISGDANTDEGVIKFQNLEPGMNYYVKEYASASGYKLNPNVYLITAGAANTTATAIKGVWALEDNQPVDVTDNADKNGLSSGAIVNQPDGSDLEWGKTKTGEQAALADSEWVLTKTDTDPLKQWLITDDTADIGSVSILFDGADAGDSKAIKQGQTITFGSLVTPKTEGEEVNPEVRWTSNPEDGVLLKPNSVDHTVEVTVLTVPSNGIVTLTATAADGETKDTITLHVASITVSEVTVSLASPIKVGDSVTATATVKDAEGNILTLQPEWSSDNSRVASVDPQTGLVTGESAGTTTIKATVNGVTGTASITVNPEASAYDTTVYVQWEGQNTVYINYKLGKGDWVNGKPMDAATCNFKQYTIPAQSDETVLIYFSNENGKNGSTNSSDYKNATGKTVESGHAEGDKFRLTTNGTPWRIWSDGYVENQALPDVCPTRKPAPRKAKTARVENISEWSHIDTTGWGADKQLQDQNPAVGKFKVVGLEDGTYTLQENKAPDGYFINPTIYTITIANGTVIWDPEPGKDTSGLHWIEDVPTEFNWDKVDAGYSADDTDHKRNPIAGSKWRLEKFKAPTTAGANGTYETDIAEIKDCTSDDQSGCAIDKDSEAGKFKLTGRALGKYRLVETEAPTGYTKLDTYYYFELSTMDPANPLPVKWTAGTKDSWDKQTGSYKGTTTKSEKTVEVNAAPNYRSPGDVYWGKVSSELNSENKHVYLGGSAWEVTYTPATGDGGQSVTVQIADCVKSGGKETGTCTAAKDDPAWAYDAYPAEGRIGFRNLPWGTYTMKETKAPDGYNVDSETIYTFTVDATHLENVKIYKQVTNGDPVEIPPASNPEGAELPDYPNQVISNTPGVVLPATGGEGNTLIVLFGFALIAISMLGCGVAMRKRI